MTTPTTATKIPTLIVGSDDLKKAIDSIINRGKKLDDAIQLTGLSLLNHIEDHGDVTLLNRLIIQFPKGSRRNAFAEWALAHGKVELNTGKDAKEVPFLHSKVKVTQLELAASKMWTEFKPEQDLDQVFDFQKMLLALLNKAGKAKNLEGHELLAKVKALAETGA